jgi:hypothetical protein
MCVDKINIFKLISKRWCIRVFSGLMYIRILFSDGFLCECSTKKFDFVKSLKIPSLPKRLSVCTLQKRSRGIVFWDISTTCFVFRTFSLSSWRFLFLRKYLRVVITGMGFFYWFHSESPSLSRHGFRLPPQLVAGGGGCFAYSRGTEIDGDQPFIVRAIGEFPPPVLRISHSVKYSKSGALPS